LKRHFNSKDQVKDWIIEFNLKSVPTVEERRRLLSHYLRVVDGNEEEFHVMKSMDSFLNNMAEDGDEIMLLRQKIIGLR
jgi:hypothetical protein